ncbi:MAG: 2Fe-2S iron-sulfur cluster-binding protein, partial [Novosphingobium sp.]|nr:2Fe-2S iron-sulfur cluster-binding protein [Novosphingobium sp.]
DGIDALCGFMRQCGTCHVYIAPASREKVGPPNEDEQTMLEALEGVEVRPTSRLSCQIQLSEELDGLVVEVPPDQPGV